MKFGVRGTPVVIGIPFLLVIGALGSVFARTYDAWHVLTWVLIVTASVLIHEFGHVAALKFYGYRSQVKLVWSGGLTTSELDRPLPATHSIVVSLAGPAAGIAFGLFMELLLINVDSGWGGFVRQQSWFVNIWWSLLNLLPIAPLDGGHVVQELIQTGSERKMLWLATVGFGLSIGVTAGVGIAFGFSPLVIGILLAVAVLTNLRFLELTPTQRARGEVAKAHRELLEGDLDHGIARTYDLLNGRSGHLVDVATYTTFAWALLRRGRVGELASLDPERFERDHRALLNSAVAWYRGNLPHAYSLLTHSLANSDEPPPSELFRYSFTRIGELDELQSWIRQLPPTQQPGARQRLATSIGS